MTDDELDALVKRLEPQAKARPNWYKIKVAMLAGVGFGYVLLMLILAIGFTALIGIGIAKKPNALLIKLGLVALFFTFMILRALWVKFPKPEGVQITSEMAPRLYEMVSSIGKQLRCAPVHAVLITEEFNAAMLQRPRLGMLGWQQNFLICGLPLMLALSPDQFKSVIAHEMGHLSGSHGRFGGWIYRVNNAWYSLMAQMASGNSWMTGIFSGFFKRFIPYFNAYTFVLRRQNEFEADQASVDIAGRQPAGESLVLLCSHIDAANAHFWDKINQRVQTEEAPPEDVYQVLIEELRSDQQQQDATDCLHAALKRPTDTVDTHPSLRDRLTTMGYLTADTKAEDVPIPPLPTLTAAEEFLGSAMQDLSRQFNAKWHQTFSGEWKARHTTAKTDLQRLAELDAKSDADDFTTEERFERTLLISAYRPAEDVMSQFQKVLAEKPEHVGANFRVAHLMLSKQKNREGLTHLERAMQADPEAVLPGCRLAYQFHMDHGEPELAKPYQRRAISMEDENNHASNERSTIPDDIHLTPHDLPPEAIDPLIQGLTREAPVHEAYVFRRGVVYRRDVPCYLLLVIPKFGTFKLVDDNTYNKLSQKLADSLPLPPTMVVFVSGSGRKALTKRITRLGFGLIYRRK